MNARRSAFVCLILLLGLPAHPGFAQPAVPEALEPWREWVLFGQEHRACPVLNGRGTAQASNFICAWPGELEISVDLGGAAFEQAWTLYREAWVPLPGDDRSWPVGVEIDGAGFTADDRVAGRLNRGWRLDMAAPYTMMMAAIGGENLLVTEGPEAGTQGVELRAQNLQLAATARLPALFSLPVTGYTDDAGRGRHLGLALVLQGRDARLGALAQLRPAQMAPLGLDGLERRGCLARQGRSGKPLSTGALRPRWNSLRRRIVIRTSPPSRRQQDVTQRVAFASDRRARARTGVRRRSVAGRVGRREP